MTDRTYRTMVGLALLIVLYFDYRMVMYFIIGVLLFEGVTNIRLPMMVGSFRKYVLKDNYAYADAGLVENPKFNIESERLWRLVVSLFLFIGYFLIDALWFFPWFMGFAIFGAGLSGVCPVLLAIRWLGFK